MHCAPPSHSISQLPPKRQCRKADVGEGFKVHNRLPQLHKTGGNSDLFPSQRKATHLLRLAAQGWFQVHRKEKGELLFPRHPCISSVLCSSRAGETHALVAIARVQQLHALYIRGTANDSIATLHYTLRVLQPIFFAKLRLIFNHSCS